MEVRDVGFERFTLEKSYRRNHMTVMITAREMTTYALCYDIFCATALNGLGVLSLIIMLDTAVILVISQN